MRKNELNGKNPAKQFFLIELKKEKKKTFPYRPNKLYVCVVVRIVGVKFVTKSHVQRIYYKYTVTIHVIIN